MGTTWLSYSLADFLMFGPEVFLRLFVRINQDIWPWQGVAVVMVIAIGTLLVRGDAMARRSALLLVAAAWLWSGAGFLMHYYGPINLPAIWFGWAFVLQGALLTVAGLFWPWNAATNRPIWSRWLMGTGWIALMGLSPLLAVAQTGNGQAAALFAVTPDVTALGAVPCMLLFPRRVRWLFLLLPLIWSLFSVATLWTLGTWVLAVIPGTTLVLAAMACFVSPRQARNPD
ncbi:DUF6064 family protein [Marinobacter salarius]|uniref:DUF6064 family protein n=1 Tax=Marinobacter salarius TaxID=1420917 RepID=UPI0010AA4FF0|nr:MULTISPECIES: DUF6064 family protein [Marinobacter]MBJ7299519.1 hypothetical protein [Marinobacter salarius]MCC4284668.1 DUF6064 family protein [Marinobacter salarius]HIO28999.1 hypothetical protein [Marinobacter salarius]HIO98752.1 hypothetical protein [Marinobacter salarius]